MNDVTDRADALRNLIAAGIPLTDYTRDAAIRALNELIAEIRSLRAATSQATDTIAGDNSRMPAGPDEDPS